MTHPIRTSSITTRIEGRFVSVESVATGDLVWVACAGCGKTRNGARIVKVVKGVAHTTPHHDLDWPCGATTTMRGALR